METTHEKANANEAAVGATLSHRRDDRAALCGRRSRDCCWTYEALGNEALGIDHDLD